MPSSSIESHNNSQHALATYGCDLRKEEEVLALFGNTNAKKFPCDVWRDETNTVLLASNYPDCIQEGTIFCVLCAGFAYRYEDAFGSSFDNSRPTFAKTILNYCEVQYGCAGRRDELTDARNIAKEVGDCLKRVSGYFSVYLVGKNLGRRKFPALWAWNDPFGFMPVYHASNCDSGAVALSSHWDCLPPILDELSLDWDVVAEYLTFGTTLGGGTGLSDRTFVQGIRNIRAGCCLDIIKNTNDADDIQRNLSRCAQSYGACEHICSSYSPPSSFGTTTTYQRLGFPPQRRSCCNRIRLAGKKKTPPSGAPLTVNDEVLRNLFEAIMQCIEASIRLGFVSASALTGGGDTRLLLACLLLQKQHLTLVFQTHSKQRTDWIIARHLARRFLLQHKRIEATSTTVEGYQPFSRCSREEALLSNLHDQTPLRRKQRRRRDKYKQNILAYTLHGRFGTEFLGNLCFDKSPLDVRNREDLDDLRAKATPLFQTVFGSATDVQNPMDSLSDRFEMLEADKVTLSRFFSDENGIKQQAPVSFDVAYGLHLQLFTRSYFSDIYKGLRGGSWFSFPSAQFTRNQITPFLDNQLLKLMLCRVPSCDKYEPYQLYGRIYQLMVPEELRKVPSNNKLLCCHSDIPWALKSYEATARPFRPKKLKKNLDYTELEQKFTPTFWKGAMVIFSEVPVNVDSSTIYSKIANDQRPEVKSLVEHVGSKEACLLSGRLQSFLLWFERRYAPHQRSQ
ncbi:hypothetical protein ACHAWF_010315 [Thalassiosira exigua]